MDDDTQEIIEKCREFARIDRECIELSYESSTPQNEEQFIDYLSGLFSICARAFDIKNKIRMMLGEQDNLNIHDAELEDLIRKIRNGEEFYTEKQYKRLAPIFNANADERDGVWPIDSRDFIHDDPDAYVNFNGKVDHVEYFVRSMKVGALISKRKVSPSVKVCFMEIRESYSFGLHRSAIALCRAMLESAFFVVLDRRGYLAEDGSKVVKIDLAKEDRLYRIIKDAHNMGAIDYDTKEDAFSVKNQANKLVIHAKGSESQITEADAFDVIQKTIRVVERLYTT